MMFKDSGKDISSFWREAMPSTSIADESIVCPVDGKQSFELCAGYDESAMEKATYDTDRLDEDEAVNEAAERLKTRYLYRFFKRLFDIVFSLFVLIAFFWLFLIVAIAIKVDDSTGSVLFKQKTSPALKMSNDPRVTRVSRWLRKLSLNEIPQFVDFLKNDIPSRILKTSQGFSLKKPGAFALFAKSAQIRIAASRQFGAGICAITGVPQNLFEYFIVGYGEIRENFAKRGSHIDFPLLDRIMPVPCNGLPI